ncbi:MAG: photosystem II reaction center PsbP family protein [Acidimicrobiia bacterium]|nr:photosystem II reaction center PsbP family protein [Acidimicrobiia bacterium]
MATARALIVGAAAAVLLAGCSAGTSTTTTSSTVPPRVTIPESLLDTVTLPDLGFQIDYPLDWTEASEVGVLGFYAPAAQGDNFAENFNVVVFPVPAEMPFETYVQTDARTLESNPNISVIGSGSATLDGRPASSVLFTTTAENGAPVTVLRIIALKDGRAYELSFLANTEQFDSYLPLFDALSSSFAFTD